MGAYGALGPDDVLALVVDHDPECMYYTPLADHGADAFTFDYLERGPVTWRRLGLIVLGLLAASQLTAFLP